MKFSLLASYLSKLEKTSSRLEITSILSELFSKTSSSEIDKVIYLTLGQLAPPYEGVVLNVAEKMMFRVLSLAYKTDIDEIKLIYKKVGDIGDVASHLAKVNDKSTGLSVDEVHKRLMDIANDSGEGSQERKVAKTAEILSLMDPLSAKYISRIPTGKLRLGFSEKTIIDALSGHDKIVQKKIKEAYSIRPDIGYIGKLVKEGNLDSVTPTVGVPLDPMLTQRLNSTSEMVKKMGEVAVEPKYDGLRIFIHFRKKDNFIRIFTRNMNAIDINTFPELLSVGDYIKADEVILDTEAVGVDPKREMFLDFQKTIQRRRKHGVGEASSSIPLQFQVFDLLLLNGKSLLTLPYYKRREELNKTIVNGSLIKIDETTYTKDPNVIRSLHEKYLKVGLEGVVVKKKDGLYVSGRTGWNWVKMKESEGMVGRLSDTIDCIVMGYFAGKGKRAQFGLGKILVGIKDGDKVRTLTKVGTGLTEEMLVNLKSRLDALSSDSIPNGYETQKDLIPDVWANPSLVVEIAADSISVSTKHSLGLSLRFPRLVKLRDDKSPDQATTLKELKSIFELQKK